MDLCLGETISPFFNSLRKKLATQALRERSASMKTVWGDQFSTTLLINRCEMSSLLSAPTKKRDWMLPPLALCANAEMEKKVTVECVD